MRIHVKYCKFFNLDYYSIYSGKANPVKDLPIIPRKLCYVKKNELATG